MVGFSAVGFALTIVGVLEFDSACWAVCDAHLLCPGEYLFSELFVFSGACSAHRVSLFCVCGVCCLFVLGGGASQRQRDERLHRLTLLSVFSVLFLLFPVFLPLFSFLLNGVCCVVRAQPCEHARNTAHALMFWFVYLMHCVLLLPQRSVCCSHHTLFTVNDRHAHH